MSTLGEDGGDCGRLYEGQVVQVDLEKVGAVGGNSHDRSVGKLRTAVELELEQH